MRYIAIAIAALFALPFVAEPAFAKTPHQIKQENKAKEYKAKKASEKAAKQSKKK
jgi:hypothetical protein